MIMKRTMFFLIFGLLAQAGYSQYAEIMDCKIYYNDKNLMYPYFVVKNITDNDTIIYAGLKFKLFSSKSNIKKGKYDYVPFYNYHVGNGGEAYGGMATFGSLNKIPPGKEITHAFTEAPWQFRRNDVVGIRIVSLYVEFSSGKKVYVDGYPKNARVIYNPDL